jgi:Fe2+ or Zn2+ uptake regulation protein
MRVSVYKNKISKLLKRSHLLSIADIHKKISGADFSTVYRNIEQLVSSGEVRKVILGKDNIVYEINKESNNHSHFVCTKCGNIEEVHISFNKLLINHIVTDILIRGLCDRCNQI